MLLNKILKKIIISLLLLFVPSICLAHFGTIMSQKTMLDQAHRKTRLLFAFMHPFEQNAMDLTLGQAWAVNLTTSDKENLLSKLKPIKFLEHRAYRTIFRPKRPGVYCIYMVPKPYWEPAEDKFIKHITKTYIGAFGEEDGWSKPLGLEVEIVPITRPFGLYAGNVFQGKVLRNGKPVPNCEVEVEYYNKKSRYKAPSEYMITQVILTDDNGIFTYSAPIAGWWGFSALTTADYKLKQNGVDKDVEVGGVIWVKFSSIKKNR